MSNKAIEYPHPVLNEYTNDFTGCAFSIKDVSYKDVGESIDIELSYDLKCDGIADLLSKGLAKIIIRLKSSVTSFRCVYDMELNDTTIISVPKRNISDNVEIEAIIVATKDFSYSLPEFNREFFENVSFSLRKGDVIANEPGLKIKLNSVIEKNVGGIVQINTDLSCSEMKVSFASRDDVNPAFSDYIYITLPKKEYESYVNLRNKKYFKNGIERFLQCAIVFPVIIEAVARLREEEIYTKEDSEPHYKETVWADTIYKALEKLGIDLYETGLSYYEIANKLLGNVVSDSIDNLTDKLVEWSTIRGEDDL